MDNPQKYLEQTRQRLQQLVQNLVSFRRTLISSPPDSVPPLTTLQTHLSVLSSNLDGLSSLINTHFPAFPPQIRDNANAIVSYPLPSFPGPSQEVLLNTLLTKRPTPEMADKIYSALVEGESTVDSELEELWQNAASIAVQEQEARGWFDVVLTEEEHDAGVKIEDVVPDVQARSEEQEGAAGDEKRRRNREREQQMLIGILRFAGTGVKIEDQPPLPKALGVGVVKKP